MLLDERMATLANIIASLSLLFKHFAQYNAYKHELTRKITNE